jgi:hypothetical protein
MFIVTDHPMKIGDKVYNPDKDGRIKLGEKGTKAYFEMQRGKRSNDSLRVGGRGSDISTPCSRQKIWDIYVGRR